MVLELSRFNRDPSSPRFAIHASSWNFRRRKVRSARRERERSRRAPISHASKFHPQEYRRTTQPIFKGLRSGPRPQGLRQVFGYSFAQTFHVRSATAGALDASRKPAGLASVGAYEPQGLRSARGHLVNELTAA